jgi:hypothetical protein
MNYLEEVFRQTADGGYFDFTRCQRPSGTFYGTAGQCKSGDEVGPAEQPAAAPKAKSGGVKVGTEKRLMALSVGQLKQLREDPRLYDYQKKKIDDILAKKGGESAKPEPKAEKKDWYTREKHKADLRKRIKEKEESKYYQTLADVDLTYKSMRDFLKSPGMDTPENRAAVTAMRALRMKMVYAEIEKYRASAKGKAAALTNSPKYDKIPGSDKPVSVDQLGDNVNKYLSLQKAVNERQKKLDALEKLPWEEKKAKGYQKLDDEQMRDNGAMISLSRQRDFIELSKIYEAQGFNAKPELVAKRSDLEKRNDLITRDNGKPLIMYRGVLSEEFADQFRGVGKDGGTHFAGQGIFGNGTYAASATPKSDDVSAQKTAKEYSGWNSTPAHITAFGIRKDANVVDFNQGSSAERSAAFNQWYARTLDQASRKTGLPVNDLGHAAAILGIHAYRVPQDEKEDYWVILNRGALVAAADSQL